MPSSGVQTSALDRKSTRLNSSHTLISYAVFSLKKKKKPIGSVTTDHKVYINTPVTAHTKHCPLTFLCLPFATPSFPLSPSCRLLFFFFNDTATTEIYTLSLHDALPILNSSHTLISYAVFCLRDESVTGV